MRLVTLCLVVLSSLVFVVAVASRLSKSGHYTVFGHPVLVELSGSMSPVIRTGDLIIDTSVSGSQAEHLRVGQIVTFGVGTDASRILTHRIVGVHISAPDEVSYATKGDDNDARDAGLVSSARVLGVYRFKIPGGGYVLDVLRQPMALGLFVLVALLGSVVGPLMRWSRRPAAPVVSCSQSSAP